jgi:ribonuclease D
MIDFDKFQLIENKYLVNDYIENNECLTMHDLGFNIDNITVVTSLDNFENIKSLIISSSKVGLDCEFKSSVIPYCTSDINLLQIATETHCFIFDFDKLKKEEEIRKFCVELFENDNIKKIGFDLKGDIKHMISSLNMEFMFIRSLFDLYSIYEELHGEKSALANVVKQYLGKELDKFEQCSDWQTKPLRKGQIVYAAKDAICLVRLYDVMKQKENFEEILMEDNDKITL